MREFPIGVCKKTYTITGGIRRQDWGRVLPLCLVVCCLLLGLLQTGVVALEPPQPEERTLEVPYTLADRDGTTSEAKQALNQVYQDDSANGDQGGDIQAAESEASNFDCTRQHTAVPGDTLLAIAIRYDVTVTAIRQRRLGLPLLR